MTARQRIEQLKRRRRALVALAAATQERLDELDAELRAAAVTFTRVSVERPLTRAEALQWLTILALLS